MSISAGIAVVCAFSLDALVAEPPGRVHPVAWLGRLIAPFDHDWQHPLLVGVFVAICVPLVSAAGIGAVVVIANAVHPVAGSVTAGIVLFVTTSRRMLLDTAREVVVLTESDLSEARDRLRALAGRDAGSLSAGQIRSAAVESAGENFSDGLVAPLFAFTLLAPVSLTLGAAGAAWVKAVNTLDSMLGYEHKRVGTASARLDDGVMWLPARTSALLLALTSGSVAVLSAQRAWLDSVPSPNAGWPMGTLAAVTDSRLEKPGVYTLNPDGSLPSVERANSAIRLVTLASVLAFAIAAIVPVALTLFVDPLTVILLVLTEGLSWS
jgi:adenosylcobinamide-phosphate synthase